jgi:hypothetical protein
MSKTSTEINGRLIALDARPDRTDLRDLPYRPSADNLPPQFPVGADITRFLPAYREAKLILDQGREGACTGFGLAAAINYLLWKRSGMTMPAEEQVSPRMIYQLARYYDEWPDENYEGSSCRGALKGWHKHGVCSAGKWPYQIGDASTYLEPLEGWERDALRRPLGVYYRIDKQSVVDMQSAIAHTGAIYVSANVHQGWREVDAGSGAMTHEKLPRIALSDLILGGHAFALVGYNEFGFIVQNSWGDRWGAAGFAIMGYRDWVENGTDAWVVGLGVPVDDACAFRAFVGAGALSGQQAPVAGWPGGRDPLEGRGDALTREQAYLHTLVASNNGMLQNRMPFLADAAANVRVVCLESPRKWLSARPAGLRHAALFLHGGLNDEDASIRRIRVLAPYFQRNGIYPLFLTWKSGWREIIDDMLKDKVNALFGAAPVRGWREAHNEARDRAVEVLAREVLVRSMWSEMKQNLEAGADLGINAGLAVLAQQMHALKTALGGDLKLHLIAHSAGAIAAGHLLREFGALRETVDSCTLYAPACTVDFALTHYQGAVARQTLPQQRLTIHALADRLELDDTVGPYHKSLLYLISRSLEPLHKTPVLGMANAHDPAKAREEFWHKNAVPNLQAWQRFFPAQNGALRILEQDQVSNGAAMIAANHGCFDNAQAVLAGTVADILGAVQAPFPDVDLRY